MRVLFRIRSKWTPTRDFSIVGLDMINRFVLKQRPPTALSITIELHFMCTTSQLRIVHIAQKIAYSHCALIRILVPSHALGSINICLFLILVVDTKGGVRHHMQALCSPSPS